MKISLIKYIFNSSLQKLHKNFSRFFTDEITIKNNNKWKKERLEMKTCWIPLRLLIKHAAFYAVKRLFRETKGNLLYEFMGASGRKIYLKLLN